jgi:hypothetical protein
MKQLQPSTLLPWLFESIAGDQRLTVLHIGPALPETVAFFADYRCKLYFVDLAADVPPAAADMGPGQLQAHFADQLNLPPESLIDVCLFWDIFNFLGTDALRALAAALRPQLAAHCRAHGFALHNLRRAQQGELYAINSPGEIIVRRRQPAARGYQPLPLKVLKVHLRHFEFTRSILLPDGRLELALSLRR